MTKRIFQIVGLVFLAGCAVERAQVAQDAQNRMIGLTKEQVLACMGAPTNKTTERQTEVWAYNSGDGHTTTSSFGVVNASATAVGNTATGTGIGNSFTTSSSRYCLVNVVMNGGKVSRVNYSGPTGGLITNGEQCAFAVRSCVQS